MTKSKERMVVRTFTLDEDKHARLRALSERTRIPAGELIREGLETVLSIAERQWRMVAHVQDRKSVV